MSKRKCTTDIVKSKKKRKAITLETKYEIVKTHEAGTNVKKICDKFSLNSSTVCTILKDKQKYLSLVKNAQPLQSTYARKKEAGIIIPEVEKLLNAWISDKTQRMHTNVNQASICSKALSLFTMLKEKKGDTAKDEIFVASRGWFDRFKKRSLGKASSSKDSGVEDYDLKHPRHEQDMSTSSTFENELFDKIGSSGVNSHDVETNVSHTNEKIVPTISHLSGANDALSKAKKRNYADYVISSETSESGELGDIGDPLAKTQVDIFGETIAMQLKLLPTRQSLSVQLKIQNILTQELLRYEESKQSSQALLSLKTEPEPQIPESPPQISNASSFSFPYQMAQKQPLSQVERIDEASVSGVKQNKEIFASPSIEATHQRIDQPLKDLDQNLQSQSKKRKFDEHSIIQATNKLERTEDVCEKSLIERQTYLFGKSVVVQLKQIPKRQRLKLQLGIQNILTAELLLYEDTKESSITSEPQENPPSFRKDSSSSSNDLGSMVLPNQVSSSGKPISHIELKVEADEEDPLLFFKEEVTDFN